MLIVAIAVALAGTVLGANMERIIYYVYIEKFIK